MSTKPNEQRGACGQCDVPVPCVAICARTQQAIVSFTVRCEYCGHLPCDCTERTPNMLTSMLIKDPPVEPTTASQMLRECAQSTWDFKEQRDELLAVLKDVIATLRQEAPGTPLNNRRFDELGARAYAAIAKAEGR